MELPWRPGTVGTTKPRYEPRAPQAAVVDEDALRTAGYDDAAVRRLCALRDAYPYLEFTRDNAEWNRVRFQSWRFKKGHMT